MSNNQSSGGIGCLTTLALIFIVLKLLNVITWSWWWVLSPLWIQIIIVLIVLLIIAIIAGNTGL